MRRRGNLQRWSKLRAALSDIASNIRVTKSDCLYVNGDCREVLRKIPDDIVDCVITSPPYGQLKDYGAKGQIGYGQESDSEYLRDISAVLVELHRACTTGAALWVVLDTVKQSGQTLLLPWEVITRAKNAGWLFQDIVIWDKGRSLPWSHVGHFRGVFEYILLFGKDKLKHFALDKVRETTHLSSYWVKYPERFNPQGKAPSDLWHFPIPVQGSWSRNGIRHLCPFPTPMVARMISLTTRPGDLVLDPFAGTGAVPTIASYLKRRGLGIELNKAFTHNFSRKGYDSLLQIAKTEINGSGKPSRGLDKLIIRLRMLKYAKSLFTELSRPDRLGQKARNYVEGFLVFKKRTRPERSNQYQEKTLGDITVLVLAGEIANLSRLRKIVSELILVPPLSKFGLSVKIQVVSVKTWKSGKFIKTLETSRWYVYRKGIFNKYELWLSREEIVITLRDPFLHAAQRVPPIFSTIMADVAPAIS